MATIRIPFDVQNAVFRTTAFPQIVQANGTNCPIFGLAFDAATDEACFFDFEAESYGSGNLSLDIEWYASTATSGDVVYGAQISALTPNVDTQDVETASFAAASTVTDSHLGTVGKRLHRCTLTITNLDSIAAGDRVRLRLYRDAVAGADTMAGDAIITALKISYSDT